MQFVSKLTPEQWAEARHLRADGLTYARIASRFDISAPSLASRARKEGWVTPGESAPDAGSGRRVKVRRPSPATADIRKRLARRLYSVIEFRIRMMELRMQKHLEALERDGDGTEPPAFTRDERDSLAALIESINQVTEMASEPASAAPGRRKSAINPELTALSDELDAAGLAAASEKDDRTARLAEQLAKVVGPA